MCFDIIHPKGFNRASGKVEINNGTLVFKNHVWKLDLPHLGENTY